MPEKPDKRKLEEKYIQLQLLDAQMQEVERELDALDLQTAEMRGLVLAIYDLGNVKLQSDALSPLGGGFYVKSRVLDSKNLLVNVGANVMVQKTAAEAEQILNKKITQLEGVAAKLTQNLQSLVAQASQVQQQLQSLILSK